MTQEADSLLVMTHVSSSQKKIHQFLIIWRKRAQLIHHLLSGQFPTINGLLVFFNSAVYRSASSGPLFHLEHNYFSFDSAEMKEQCREIGK